MAVAADPLGAFLQVGSSGMREQLQCAARWAPLPYPVLIVGERGTGKSLLALQLHAASSRAGVLVTVAMTHLSRGLEVAELVGTARGAFTDATDREGAFVRGHRGTVFLDELGRATVEAQGALLTILDSGRFTPLGSKREVVADVRVVAATNADLAALAGDGRFLEDLLDRFGYLVLTMPPLRERRDEVLPLARVFLERESARWTKRAPVLTADVERLFLKAPWPGNVRQLLRVCEYVVANGVETVEVGDLPAPWLATLGIKADRPTEPFLVRARRVLAECGGNKTRAAQRLGISRGQLHRVLKAAAE